MRQFYLSRNRCCYYRGHFVDPVTHVQGVGKSTHTKDRDEAILIADQWLLGSIPMAMSNSRAFAEGTGPKIPVGGGKVKKKRSFKPLWYLLMPVQQLCCGKLLELLQLASELESKELIFDFLI